MTVSMADPDHVPLLGERGSYVRTVIFDGLVRAMSALQQSEEGSRLVALVVPDTALETRFLDR